MLADRERIPFLVASTKLEKERANQMMNIVKDNPLFNEMTTYANWSYTRQKALNEEKEKIIEEYGFESEEYKEVRTKLDAKVIEEDGYSGRYDGRVYARGGRYSRSGLTDKLHELMDEAPDDRTRMEIKRLIEKM